MCQIIVRHGRRLLLIAPFILISGCTEVVTAMKQADATGTRGAPAVSAQPVPLTEPGTPAAEPAVQTAAIPASRPAEPAVTPRPVVATPAATPSAVVAPPTPTHVAATAEVSAPAAKAAAARQAETTADLAALQRQLTDLESKVAALTAENQRQMERLTMVTNGAIADMEQLFNALRLELRSSPTDPVTAPSNLRRRSSAPASSHAKPPSGQGGPFQPLPPQARRIERAPADPAEPLLPDLQTLMMLHKIVRALPLSPPLEEAVVTGPFGYRRDPFNRRAAFHDGIDLQAPMRSPVHATASGTVVVAGMRPAYGRVIEIDHGFGIRTRYAHLASLGVKEGDRIERNQLLGALGSSGRSASPHLHYEVLFNGRPHDPADLLVLAEGIRSLR